MHPELADEGIERHHLRRVIGGHPHGFLGRQDVELAGIEDQRAAAIRRQRLPEIAGAVAARTVHVDQPGMALGPVADQPVEAREIDRDRNAPLERDGGGVDEGVAGVERGQIGLIQPRIALAEADLRKPRAGPHPHGEGAR